MIQSGLSLTATPGYSQLVTSGITTVATGNSSVAVSVAGVAASLNASVGSSSVMFNVGSEPSGVRGAVGLSQVSFSATGATGANSSTGLSTAIFLATGQATATIRTTGNIVITTSVDGQFAAKATGSGISGLSISVLGATSGDQSISTTGVVFNVIGRSGLMFGSDGISSVFFDVGGNARLKPQWGVTRMQTTQKVTT